MSCRLFNHLLHQLSIFSFAFKASLPRIASPPLIKAPVHILCTSEIKKYFEDNEISGVIQYRSYGQENTEIRKWQFSYFKEKDVYMYPKTGIILPYRNIDKFGYKQYYDRKQCERCPYQKQCCEKTKFRTIRRLICEEVNERARERRLSKEGKTLFKKRKTTVERSFGDSKQNHGYRYTLFKGVEKNQAYTHLICAAQNMKNIAIKRTNIDEKVHDSQIFIDIFVKMTEKIKMYINRVEKIN